MWRVVPRISMTGIGWDIKLLEVPPQLDYWLLMDLTVVVAYLAVDFPCSRVYHITLLSGNTPTVSNSPGTHGRWACSSTGQVECHDCSLAIHLSPQEWPTVA